MFRKLLFTASLLVFGGLFCQSSFAQSTASQVVTGYLSTSGCASGQTVCFVQFGPGSGSLSNVIITSPAVALDSTVSAPQQTHSGIIGNGTYILDPSTGLPITYTAPTNVTPVPQTGASFGITPVKSASAESNHVLDATAGNLYSVYVTTGATAGFLMLFNATSAPADGAVTPIECLIAPANSTTGLDRSQIPDVFSTGITSVFSSTGCFTKTASATAFFSGLVK